MNKGPQPNITLDNTVSDSAYGLAGATVPSTSFSVRAEPFDPSVEKLSLLCRMQGFEFESKETFDEAELGGVNNSSIAGNPINIVDGDGVAFHHGASCLEKWVANESCFLLSKTSSLRMLSFLLDFYAEELLTPALKVYRFGSSESEQELRENLPPLSSDRMEQLCWLNRQKRQLKLYGMHESNSAATNAHVQRVLVQLEKQIASSGFLSGTLPGYIDVIFHGPIYTYLFRQNSYKAQLAKKYPALSGWLKKMKGIGKLESPPRDFISLPGPLLTLLNIINKDCSRMIATLLAAYKHWLDEMAGEFHSLPAYIGMCSGVCMQQKMTRVVSVNFVWHMQRITEQLGLIDNRHQAPVEALLKRTGMDVLLTQVALFQNRKISFRDGSTFLEAQL